MYVPVKRACAEAAVGTRAESDKPMMPAVKRTARQAAGAMKAAVKTARVAVPACEDPDLDLAFLANDVAHVRKDAVLRHENVVRCVPGARPDERVEGLAGQELDRRVEDELASAYPVGVCFELRGNALGRTPTFSPTPVIMARRVHRWEPAEAPILLELRTA